MIFLTASPSCLTIDIAYLVSLPSFFLYPFPVLSILYTLFLFPYCIPIIPLFSLCIFPPYLSLLHPSSLSSDPPPYLSLLPPSGLSIFILTAFLSPSILYPYRLSNPCLYHFPILHLYRLLLSYIITDFPAIILGFPYTPTTCDLLLHFFFFFLSEHDPDLSLIFL